MIVVTKVFDGETWHSVHKLHQDHKGMGRQQKGWDLWDGFGQDPCSCPEQAGTGLQWLPNIETGHNGLKESVLEGKI